MAAQRCVEASSRCARQVLDSKSAVDARIELTRSVNGRCLFVTAFSL